MRILCKACGTKARISTRDEVTVEFIRLYCQCLDVHCGHTFVMNLTYSHALRPPAESVDRLLFDRLRQMPRNEQRQLFDQLSLSSS